MAAICLGVNVLSKWYEWWHSSGGYDYTLVSDNDSDIHVLDLISPIVF